MTGNASSDSMRWPKVHLLYHRVRSVTVIIVLVGAVSVINISLQVVAGPGNALDQIDLEGEHF